MPPLLARPSCAARRKTLPEWGAVRQLRILMRRVLLRVRVLRLHLRLDGELRLRLRLLLAAHARRGDDEGVRR